MKIMLEQIRNFIAIGNDVLKVEVEFPEEYGKASNVIISGMGGSGIAGDIVRDLLEDTLPKQIHVCKKSSLPAFADENTLLISISYSGDTTETLSVLNNAIDKGCRIFGMTSDGEMENIFKNQKIPYVKLPKGYAPRTALPFMLFNLINVFRKLGWIKEDTYLEELRDKRDEIEDAAKEIAKKLKGKLIIIYSGYQSVAHRFKSQLNENSKALAKYDIIPEMFHNEINSWSKASNFHIIFLNDGQESEKIKAMIEISKKLLDEDDYTEIVAKGDTKLNRMLYLIWLGDFISYYLAVENKVDPEKIPATEFLKSELQSRRNIIKKLFKKK